MQIIVGSTLRIKNADVPCRQWIKANGILPNPTYVKNLKYGFSNHNVPAKIFLFEINEGDIVAPYGWLREILNVSPDAEVISTFQEPHEVDFGCNIPLYDYQQEALEKMKESFLGILESPAGSGKTQIGLALAAAIGEKTLWLTHTLDLVNQSRKRAERYMDSKLIGVIAEGKVNIGKAITFSTVQTVEKMDLLKYQDEWDCIIVDECHRAAGTPLAVTRFFKVLNTLRARHKYGLSATVHRSDGMIAATYALLGQVSHKVPEAAVADKIMKVGVCPIPTGVKMGEDCLNSDGTINYSKLVNYLADNEERSKLIVQFLEQNKDHSCLILADRVGHLNSMMEMLPARMKSKACLIHGMMTSKVDKQLRQQYIEWMQQGKKKYLFATYALAKEGLDIPRLDRLFMASPVKDYTVVTQSIGRIARSFPDKEEPVCFDFVDDMQMLVRMWQVRCRTYRKNGCHFIEVSDDD